MRKWFLVVGLLSLSAVFFWQKRAPEKTSEITITVTATPITALQKTSAVTIAGKEYQVSYFKAGVKNISLYSNLADKKNSKELGKKYNCENFANAGFYDKNGRHLGFFLSQEKILRQQLESALFDGFFYITTDGLGDIDSLLPTSSMLFAIQSGPLLWKNGNPRILRIQNDELSRRIAVLTNNQKEIYFVAVYDKDSPLQGPFLADLPNLLLQWQAKTKVKIEAALNLDGGSASAFANGETTLSEISPIGGIFCVKSSWPS